MVPTSIIWSGSSAYIVSLYSQTPKDPYVILYKWKYSLSLLTECEPPGFRPDPSDCRIFYICSADGTEHRFRCAEELVFNLRKGYCEPPSSVPGCERKSAASARCEFFNANIGVGGRRCTPHVQLCLIECVYVCICMCVSVRVSVSVSLYMRVYVYMHTSLCLCLCACTSVYVYLIWPMSTYICLSVSLERNYP